MKVKVEEGCISCGLCIDTCPNVFKFNDEGVSVAYKQPEESDKADVEAAADGCPVNVIKID